MSAMTLFAQVATLADSLAAEAGRLKNRASIAAALTAVAATAAATGDAATLSLFTRYLAGQPFPEADPRKLNAGGALLSRAVKAVAAASDAALTAAYRRHGDLGAAAFDLLAPPFGKAPTQSTLTLTEIAAAFDTMATARSTQARFAAVEGLLRRATPLEAKYLLKLMLGDMRTGVKQSLVEEAIAIAATTAGHPAGATAVRHAVMLEADLGRAAAMAFAGTLAQARMQLFHPLGFMLASPVETPEEAIARFTEKPQPSPKPKARTATKPGAPGPASGTRDEPPQILAPTPTPCPPSAQREELHSPPPISPATPILAFLEDKYDGMRAQLHFADPSQPGRVALYSRNREDITHSFPELEEAFRNPALSTPTNPLSSRPEPPQSGGAAERPAVVPPPTPSGIILDGEILGWDYRTSKALPFAILGQRIGRKRVDNDLRRAVPVVFMAFDLLFAGGELTLPLPLSARRQKLEALVAALAHTATAPIEQDHAVFPGGLFAANAATSGEPRLLLSPAKLVSSAEAIDLAYRDARARANEGVMLKAANSAYLPGRRGLAWVKLKRELATLDVVITGAEFGHGRRAGLLSDYTFAVRSAGGDLLNVGKAYSGVTDAEILELTAWLGAHTLEDHGHFRTVEPLRVLEVAFNNIMRSDRHASGFALRFPRILRLRDDKPVIEIDTLARVEELFQSQPDRAGD
jgi:DNA ligase-1